MCQPGVKAEMKDIAIKSKIIIGLAYDQDQRRLRISFKNGETRLFSGVPEQIVADMVSSFSPGQFYVDHIREHFKRITA